jgi:hypothetical protein
MLGRPRRKHVMGLAHDRESVRAEVREEIREALLAAALEQRGS